jgi:hypothetical protein
MTDLTTLFGAQISSLTQDVRQLRVRLDGLIAEKEEIVATSKNFSDDIEARIKALEDAENHRQQDEDVECALGRSAKAPVQVTVQDQTLVDRVAFAITKDSDGPINWRGEASDAIFEVARWLRASFPGLAEGWAHYLEQEAERG